jgi:MtN3 and saliva related transmembrane protein
METWLPTAVGLLAGVLSTWSFVPQVAKIWREGDTAAISLRTFALRAFGSALWTIYGFGIGSVPVMIFSAVNVVFCTTILTLKMRASRAPQPA